jgi:hypothetical protein
MEWPHDAFVLPTTVAMGGPDPKRPALASGQPTDRKFSVFVAELNGKRLARLDAAPSRPYHGGGVYG